MGVLTSAGQLVGAMGPGLPMARSTGRRLLRAVIALLAASTWGADGPWIRPLGEPVNVDLAGSEVNAIAVSGDGAQLGPFRGVSSVHSPARLLAWTPDGKRLASLEQGGNLALQDGATGKPLGGLEPVRGNVAAMAVSADGQRVLLAAPEGQLQAWALQPR